MIEFLLLTGLQLLLAVLLDVCLGEVTRWHPLSGFGRLAKCLETWLYPPQVEHDSQRLLPGALAVVCAIVPCAAMIWLVTSVPYLGWWLEVMVLYFTLGCRSLAEHARYVSVPLAQGNLDEAREKTGWLVSRETHNLSRQDIIRATVESVLENGNDAVFGALFWFVVAGAPGAVVYRLANTLDAMWGYKNSRFLFFGRTAARLDDVMNWIPARLTVFTYAFQGNWRAALRCWWQQGSHYKSRNGGAVMAAGAGSLGIVVGGTSVYHGQTLAGPVLGKGTIPDSYDIERAVKLVSTGTWAWAGMVLLSGLFAWVVTIFTF